MDIMKMVASVAVAAIVGVGGAGLTTWANSRLQTQQIEEHGRRIDINEKKIDTMQADVSKVREDVAGIKSDVSGLKQSTDAVIRKLDMIIERQLRSQPGR